MQPKKNPTIGLVATARYAEKVHTETATQILENLGCNVVLPPNIYAQNHQLGGTDTERFENFKYLWEHPDVDALWIVRGGYGSIRICQDISELVALSNTKKWLIGYSDVTAIHGALSRLDVNSIHGTMPVNFPTNTPAAIANIVEALKTGNIPGLSWATHRYNQHGSAEGKLVGGNLSMLYSLQATPFAPDYTDAILFFEDLDEYLYHIDRILQNLWHSGVLHQIKGMVIGQLSDMNDNTTPWGKNALDIVHEYSTQLEIPVAFNAPIGHVDENLPVLHGAKVGLDVSEKGARLEYL